MVKRLWRLIKSLFCDHHDRQHMMNVKQSIWICRTCGKVLHRENSD
jgi:ribosomal protein L37AE/L43A